MSEPMQVYELPTQAEALVELMRRRLGLEVDLADVKELRGAGTVVKHGDLHFRLTLPSAPIFGPSLQLMTFYCSTCRAWLPAKVEVRSIEDVSARIAHHAAAHGDVVEAEYGTCSHAVPNTCPKCATADAQPVVA